MPTSANVVFDVLLESLKIQAEKYKIIIDSDLAHEQRKDLDTEIKQMYELLSQMTNSTIILSSSEMETLKSQFDLKLQELQLILDNPNITTVQGIQGERGVDGLNGKDFKFTDFTPEQLALLKGADGINGIDGINGQNGLNGNDFTYDLFTPEQLALLKGADGINGQNGLDGKDGNDFSYDMFTSEQLELLRGVDGNNGQDGVNGLDFDLEELTILQIQNLADKIFYSPTFQNYFDTLSVPVSPAFFYDKNSPVPVLLDYNESTSILTLESGFYKSVLNHRTIISSHVPYFQHVNSDLTLILSDGSVNVLNLINGFKIFIPASGNPEFYTITNGVEVVANLSAIDAQSLFFAFNTFDIYSNDIAGFNFSIVETISYEGSNYEHLNDYLCYYKYSFDLSGNSFSESDISNINGLDFLVISS